MGAYKPPVSDMQKESVLGNLSSRRDEEITWGFYDTEIYSSNETTDLRFFVKPNKDRCWTNMYVSAMLPNPQAFEIEAIRIFGVTADLALGSFRLRIGNKVCGEWPLWSLSVREKNFRHGGLAILPMQCFQAEIHWETPVNLGVGLSGSPKFYQPIQVLLRGTLTRPDQ